MSKRIRTNVVSPAPHSQGKRIDRLTQKQENFVVCYVKEGNGVIAYRSAYETQAKDSTVEREVKRLLARPAILERIREFRRALADRAEITVADVIRELWDNANKAKRAVPVMDKEGKATGEYKADFPASNQAFIAVGKHLGAFEKKPNEDGSPIAKLTPEERGALREAVQRERERRGLLQAGEGSLIGGAPSTIQ